MLEIRRWKSNRVYENTFFRQFAKNLKNYFDKNALDWLLIANWYCELDESLQIDALLITKSAICIIDFKNFWGKINIPNNEYSFWHIEWTNSEWTRIKWWWSINPYMQLRKQKWKLSLIIKDNIIKKLRKDDYLNPSHTKKIVCFQKKVEIVWNIPKKDEIDFLIMDNSNYLEVISDAINLENKEVTLTKKSFELFKEYFKADLFDIKEEYIENNEQVFDSKSKDLNFNWLEEDQKFALKNIDNFIQNKDDKIFILQWTVWSWKSYLIDYIEDLSFNSWISEVIKVVQSTRIARNLSSDNSIFNSMYSTIYWWKNKKENNTNLEIVPIRNNEDDENTIYIVDESQLIWDNYNQSFDLRFWSWMLLSDFIKYVDLENSKRKIIFIWDVFQLNIWKKWENSLYKNYLEDTYNIENIRYYQLNDKEENNFLWTQLFSIVKSIRNNIFNNLNFTTSNNLELIEKNNTLQLIQKKIENNIDFHILSYSNHDSNKINLWIKNNIIKNWEDLWIWDLIIINNNITIVNNDPFSTPSKVYNGEFWIIENVSNEVISETVEIEKGKSILLKFREVELTLKLSKEKVKVYSFENFRHSEKWELSQEEVIAFHIILNREIQESYDQIPFKNTKYYSEIKKHNYFNDEKSFVDKVINDWKIKSENNKQKELKKEVNKLKREDKEDRKRKILLDNKSKSYMVKNSAYLKYWWSLTVHKSISYKWDEILINTNTWWWRTNDTYFKWLYTWLTRAKNKVYLLNFKWINSFTWVEFSENISNNNSKILFKAEEKIDLSDDDKRIIKKYDFPSDYSNILLQFYKYIWTKFIWTDVVISDIIHNQYLENYELKKWEDKINLSVYYNNKWEFKSLTLNKASNEQFKRNIERLIENENKIKDFTIINDDWRKLIYQNIAKTLKEKDIYFKYIIQNMYKDTIKLSMLWEIIIFDLYYNWSGFITKIILRYSDNINIWEILKNNIKESYDS